MKFVLEVDLNNEFNQRGGNLRASIEDMVAQLPELIPVDAHVPALLEVLNGNDAVLLEAFSKTTNHATARMGVQQEAFDTGNYTDIQRKNLRLAGHAELCETKQEVRNIAGHR